LSEVEGAFRPVSQVLVCTELVCRHFCGCVEFGVALSAAVFGLAEVVPELFEFADAFGIEFGDVVGAWCGGNHIDHVSHCVLSVGLIGTAMCRRRLPAFRPFSAGLTCSAADTYGPLCPVVSLSRLNLVVGSGFVKPLVQDLLWCDCEGWEFEGGDVYGHVGVCEGCDGVEDALVFGLGDVGLGGACGLVGG
jgi:hypothetical protein